MKNSAHYQSIFIKLSPGNNYNINNLYIQTPPGIAPCPASPEASGESAPG